MLPHDPLLPSSPPFPCSSNIARSTIRMQVVVSCDKYDGPHHMHRKEHLVIILITKANPAEARRAIPTWFVLSLWTSYGSTCKGSKCDHILRIFYPGLHMFHISCTRMTWQSVLHNSGGLSSDCMLDIKLSPDSVAVWSYCGSHQGQPVSKKLQVFHRLCGFGGSHLS